jgi:hypothetical protein
MEEQGRYGGGAPGGGGGQTGPSEAELALARYRQSAYDDMIAVLRSFGIDPDGSGLASTIWGWVQQDRSAGWIKIELRNSDAYKTRFPGMAELIKKGQFMDEATYIEQERQYRNVMTQWGLPTGFYDDPTDYAKLIVNGVSVKELDDRIVTAKTFLDRPERQPYRQALKDLYGVDEGGMLAYVLDGERAQATIQKQMKEAAITGAATRGNFDLSAEQSAQYGATLGDQYNRITADQVKALEGSLSNLGTIADSQERLAYIENDAFKRTDVLDAELLNDRQKKLASQQRARREVARFSGTSATTKDTLRNTRGV